MDERVQSAILGDTPREFSDPDSSVIAGAYYTPESLELVVSIKAGELVREYTFGGVPAQTYVEFYQAKSRGSYFNRFIRPTFGGTLR